MSNQYEKDGTIMTEHDLLMDNSRRGSVPESIAKRATKIARMRGMMQAYKTCGLMMAYNETRLKLKVYLKNINKLSLSGKIVLKLPTHDLRNKQR